MTMAGSGGGDELQRFAGGTGLPANRHGRFLVDQIGEPFAHQRMVVHQQDFMIVRHDFWQQNGLVRAAGR